jgi:hemerythrin-like metal-binding protein
MSFAEWDHRYEIGIESVDEDHRQIIKLINDFHDLLLQGGSRAEVIDLLGVVYTNIRSHFVSEEEIMRSMDYPDYRIHKADHDRLLEEIDEISSDYEAGKYFNKPLALADRLKNWFDTHFFDMDGKLHRLEHREKADLSLP